MLQNTFLACIMVKFENWSNACFYFIGALVGDADVDIFTLSHDS